MSKIKNLVMSVWILSLFGCEAPLQLENVLKEQQKATYRSDRLQQITANETVLAVVGSFGTILVSDNQGKDWRRIQLASQDTLIDIATCPDESLVALSLEGRVWLSDDNGFSWQEKSLNTEETPQAITCAPNNSIWVVGSFSTFIVSDDHGQHWQSQSLDEDMILSYIQFFDEQNGVATGEFGTLLRTADGGKTWQAQPAIPQDFYPIASLFLSVDKGWVAGLSGKIFYTDNGGANWQVENTPTQSPIYHLSKGKDTLYATGALGTVLSRSLKQNKTQWHIHQQDTQAYLRGSQEVNGTLLISGGSGTLQQAAISVK